MNHKIIPIYPSTLKTYILKLCMCSKRNLNMAKAKNFSSLQKLWAAVDDAFRKMSCKRKLQKQKVQKNSQDMSLSPETPIRNANHLGTSIGDI